MKRHHQNKHHWMEAEVRLPGYNLDTSEVGIRMDVQFEKNSLTSIHEIPSLANRRPIEDLPPAELEHLPADGDNPHRILLYYKQPALDNKMDKYLWTLRIRHQMDADLRLPLPDPNDRDNTDSAWVIEREWTAL